MKLFLKLGFCLLLLTSLDAWSQPNNSGVVFGSVLNASQDSAAMAGQEVVLYQYVDGQEVEGARPHAATDDRGRFVFEGLQVGERFAYYPLAVFAGIEFSGALVKSTPAALRQGSDILVFEPTSSDSAISTAMHHLILEPGAGSIAARELFLFANRGNHTYVGNMPSGSKKNIVLRLEVPPNATDLQFGGDLMSCCAVVNGNQIFDTMEFKPGTRQVELNYLLPYQGKETILAKTLGHTTAALDIFLPKDHGVISAAQFGEATPFQIRGKNYLRYHAGNLAKDSILSLMISNLPAAPRDYRWRAPVILVLIIATVHALNRWRKTARLSEQADQEVIPPRGIDERRQLIGQILQLDENFEAGKIDKAAYFIERAKMVQKVLALESKDEPGGDHQITESAREEFR